MKPINLQPQQPNINIKSVNSSNNNNEIMMRNSNLISRQNYSYLPQNNLNNNNVNLVYLHS
jgi:hypothetical protein